MPSHANAQTIADLQSAIDKIGGGHRANRKSLPFGVPEIDNRLPNGGLVYGAIHEVGGGGSDAVWGAASSLFAAGIAARTVGPVIWCLSRPDLFAPAIAQVGLHPGRVIYVQGETDLAVQESFEEALRYGVPGAVVAEMVRLPMDTSRRFQLAAEKTGSLGLIIRRWRRQTEVTDFGNPTAATTRWRVSPTLSEPLPVDGIGRHRWIVELMRQRAGEAFDVVVNACDRDGAMASIRQEDVRYERYG